MNEYRGRRDGQGVIEMTQRVMKIIKKRKSHPEKERNVPEREVDRDELI